MQAQVLDLLVELQAEAGPSYLFISHDLAVVRQVAHRIGVLRRGRLLELRPADEVFNQPREEYTRELLAAMTGQRLTGSDRDAKHARRAPGTTTEERG